VTLQVLAWVCGGATALCVFRRLSPRGGDRFVLGLWLGVGLAHAGWALLQLPHLSGRPAWLLEPGAVSVLFLPLGVLCVAPWRESLAALPLALAVARLGCLPYGCCYASAWGALPELGLLAGLQLAARRRPEYAVGIVLCGFGAVRLASLPLRAPLALAPGLDPRWIALAWIVAGLVLQGRLRTAARARAWLGRRVDPPLRALVAMSWLWLLLWLSQRLPGAASPALLAASLAGLALLARPRLRTGRHRGGGRLPAALLVGGLVAGWLCAGLAGALAGASPAAGRPDPLRWLSLGVLFPLLEEIVYRERLLDGLRELAGALPALLASSGLFALGHADPGSAAFAFAGGVVCGVCRLRSGGLALPIALHAGWNQGALLISWRRHRARARARAGGRGRGRGRQRPGWRPRRYRGRFLDGGPGGR
jgi:membrane protease YdiL (CAAX protease family)